MPLNLFESDLESVTPEFRKLYVKDPASKAFRLELSDLDSYVSSRVAPVQKELQIAHENEHKLSLSVALRQAGVDPKYEALVYANLRERVQLKTVEDKRVLRILSADGETPMAGSGSNGLATLDDLAREAVKLLPTAFAKGETPGAAPSGERKIMSRAEFEKLDPMEQGRKILHEGYQLVDVEPPQKVARPAPRPGEKTMTRADFDKLNPIEKSEKIMKEGYRVVD